MGFPRQGYWSGLPFPSPGDLPDPGIQSKSSVLAGTFFTTEPLGKPKDVSALSQISLFVRLPHKHFPLPIDTQLNCLAPCKSSAWPDCSNSRLSLRGGVCCPSPRVWAGSWLLQPVQSMAEGMLCLFLAQSLKDLTASTLVSIVPQGTGSQEGSQEGPTWRVPESAWTERGGL